jgi:hypothetical protein
MTSRFFASFSLQDLIGNRFSSPSSPHCGATGGAGGGVGSVGPGRSYYHKSESLSCPIHRSGEGGFDERELIESLRASVEQEILESGASINTRGDIPGSFNSSEFFLEYTEAGTRGRIIISGNITGSTYRLRADIEERSEGGGASFPVEAFSRIRPEGDYYVVAFAREDPLARGDQLHSIGAALIKESSKRIPVSFSNNDAGSIRYAEVWTLSRMPQHVRELLQQNGMGGGHEMPEEYKGYEKVCFLNDVALRMYEEAGVALNVLKKVTDAEMPAGCSRNLRGPYIPK